MQEFLLGSNKKNNGFNKPCFPATEPKQFWGAFGYFGVGMKSSVPCKWIVGVAKRQSPIPMKLPLFDRGGSHTLAVDKSLNQLLLLFLFNSDSQHPEREYCSSK